MITCVMDSITNITLQNSLILEDAIYISFEIKNNKLYVEMDDPGDENFTTTLLKAVTKNKDNVFRYNGKEEVLYHSSFNPLILDYGIYIFVIKLSKKYLVNVNCDTNKLSIEIN